MKLKQSQVFFYNLLLFIYINVTVSYLADVYARCTTCKTFAISEIKIKQYILNIKKSFNLNILKKTIPDYLRSGIHIYALMSRPTLNY